MTQAIWLSACCLLGEATVLIITHILQPGTLLEQSL